MVATGFAVLLGIQFVFTLLGVHVPPFNRVAKSPPTLLFFRGKRYDEVLRRERISEDELLESVRLAHVGSFDEVEAVVLEEGGGISVIKKKESGDLNALADVENLPQDLKRQAERNKPAA